MAAGSTAHILERPVTEVAALVAVLADASSPAVTISGAAIVAKNATAASDLATPSRVVVPVPDAPTLATSGAVAPAVATFETAAIAVAARAAVENTAAEIAAVQPVRSPDRRAVLRIALPDRSHASRVARIPAENPAADRTASCAASRRIAVDLAVAAAARWFREER